MCTCLPEDKLYLYDFKHFSQKFSMNAAFMQPRDSVRFYCGSGVAGAVSRSKIDQNPTVKSRIFPFQVRPF